MRSQLLDSSALQETLGYRFRDAGILERALTHSSFAREAESAAGTGTVLPSDNEQLEFLGDSVLSFVVSQELFRMFPEYSEGDLSKLRAHVVSARALSRPAKQLEIGRFLRFGKGEEKSGGRSKSALLVNALEAIIAALFLDGGLDTAHQIVLKFILRPSLRELEAGSKGVLPVTDYKSALQEAVHAAGRPQPRYSVIKEEGPDHRKIFTVEVSVAAFNSDSPLITRAEGTTKKRAEQRAAREAWESLQVAKHAKGNDC
jgi:ribonuclease-3